MESETWKSMVDSVIEFIASSRATLRLLNDRLSDVEHRVQQERHRKEDDKIKQQFYKDCLKLTIDSEYTTKETTANLQKKNKFTEYCCSRSTARSNASTYGRTYKPSPIAKHATGCQMSGYRSVHCGGSGNISGSITSTNVSTSTYNNLKVSVPKSTNYNIDCSDTTVTRVNESTVTKSKRNTLGSINTVFNLTESVTKPRGYKPNSTEINLTETAPKAKGISTYGTEISLLTKKEERDKLNNSTNDNVNPQKEATAKQRRVSTTGSTNNSGRNKKVLVSKSRRDRSRSRSKITTEKHLTTQKAQIEKGIHAEGEAVAKFIPKKLQTKEKSYSYIHRNKLTPKGDT